MRCGRAHRERRAGEEWPGRDCVLHAKLAAKNEVPPTNSVAKGHTHIKVRNDGTIEFKTKINNKDRENFVAGHIHQAPVGFNGGHRGGAVLPPAPATSARHIKESGVVTPDPTERTRPAPSSATTPSAFYVNYHTEAGFPGRRDPGPTALGRKFTGADAGSPLHRDALGVLRARLSALGSVLVLVPRQDFE